MLRCDGASLGNPGNSGFGYICRDHNCHVLGSMAGGIGIATNFFGEILAVVYAGEWAISGFRF